MDGKRNALLIASDYAPVFPKRWLDDSLLQSAQGDRPGSNGALTLSGAGGRPPLDLIASNNAVPPLLAGVDPVAVGAALQCAASDVATAGSHAADKEYGGVVVPFQLKTEASTLSFIGTITVFGTPVDITLSELALESCFPADGATADAPRGLIK